MPGTVSMAHGDAFAAARSPTRSHAERWADELAALPDLATGLVKAALR